VDYTNQLLGTVDPFGRPGATYGPAIVINGVSRRRKTATIYEDAARRVIVASDLNSEGDGLLKSRATQDELGRTVLVEQSEDGTNFTTSTRTVYEQMGKITYTSNPYRSADASTDGWTRVTKDALDRVSEVATFTGKTQPSATASNWNGRATTSYDSNYTTVTDQAGKVRRSVSNALGQLVRVDEPDSNNNLGSVGSPAQPTSYSYDALGNLMQVTQGAQTRSFAYSSLSRLLSATHPESGTTLYQYDPNGNLQTKIDPRLLADNQTHLTTSYVYDGLNRLKTRSYNDGTPAVTFTYDTLANGKGRLTSVSNSVSTSSYGSYDAVGNPTTSSQTTDGQTYSLSYGYNLAGAIISETYPSGRVLTTNFDNAGRLSQLSGQKTGEADKTYVSQLGYSAHQAVKDLKLGNNLWEHTNFNSRLQPTEIDLGTTPGGVDRLKLEYNYGATTNNGNVLSQTITVPTIGTATGYVAAQSYGYDQLNRLATAQENNGASWKQTFLYDRYGNRRLDATKDAANQDKTTPSMVGPNPVMNATNNRIAPQSGEFYRYDAAGNLDRDRVNNTFTYDAENRQTKYNNGDPLLGGATYAYDGESRRVKTTVDTVTTILVYDINGRVVAEYATLQPSGSGTSYLTSDTLGTPRVITNATGGVKARHDYLPFGEELFAGTGGRTQAQGYVDDNIRQKWAKLERDAETGLDYAKARYYSSTQGRFTSVDPVKVNKSRMFDPQRFNLYAYVRNNPLKFIDPKGEDVFLNNNTEEGRRRALLSVTKPLSTAEQKNIGSRRTADGRVELYVKDPSKIDLSKASAGYKYLTERIGNHDLQINYTLLGKGQSSVVAGDGEKYTQKGLATGAGGVTIGLGGGKIDVIVAEGGVPNGVKGLTASGRDAQIAMPDYIITAHELLGETLKYTRGNERLQAQDDATKAEDSRRVIGIENEIRDFQGLPRRSGKDHEGTVDFGEVIVRP
jgi:RHS repeat-associated protein